MIFFWATGAYFFQSSLACRSQFVNLYQISFLVAAAFDISLQLFTKLIARNQVAGLLFFTFFEERFAGFKGLLGNIAELLQLRVVFSDLAEGFPGFLNIADSAGFFAPGGGLHL